MKYFKHQYSDSLGEVWGLFSGLAELSKEEKIGKDRRCSYGHTTEIMSSAMNGNLHPETFDLKAYEIACSKTDQIEIDSLRNKFLAIVDTVNGSEEDTVGYGKISSNDNRLKSIEDAFEILENNDEFERCLAELFNIRKGYIVEKGVDPVEMLVNSLKGIPEAVSSISELTKEDSVFKRIIETLCENGSNILQGRLEGAF